MGRLLGLAATVLITILGITALSISHAHAKDAGLLVFEYSTKDAYNALGISNADGTDFRVLAKFGGNPKWFPDGNRVAYFSKLQTSEFAPYTPGTTIIANLNGKKLKEIPYWVSDISPDGNKLLVQKILKADNYDDGALFELGVYDLQRDSYTPLLDPTRLSAELHLISPTMPKWFPDSRRILFQLLGNRRDSLMTPYLGELSLTDGQIKIRKIPGVVLSGHTDEFDLSPDGKRIVFSGLLENHRDEKPAIFVFELESNLVHHLHREKGNTSSYEPTWSRDGLKILFTSYMPDDLGSEITLKIMGADGSDPHRVFPVGGFHNFMNSIGVGIMERKQHADWWQPTN